MSARKWIKRLFGALAVAAVVAGGYFGLRPQPVPVDIAQASRRALEVAIEEEGVARIRDVFRISAPVSGRLLRINSEPGEAVKSESTVVASIQPPDPALLDVRSRRELEGAADAARAAVGVAEAEIARATSALRLARTNADRAERLARTGTIPEQTLERANSELSAAEAQMRQAEATLRLRQSEVSAAEARLSLPGQLPQGNQEDVPVVDVRSPIDGIVLKLLTKSEQVVTSGTPLIEIGDTRRLEIVVDLLSTDALRIGVGSAAEVTGWGRDQALAAQVRRIEPTAFTKTSALGIEEQRVHAVLDLLDPPDAWKGLGHDYRVKVRLVHWRASDVLTVPIGALFRKGSDWTVFKVVDGKAVLTRVRVGHQNLTAAEILEGLTAGDRLILHPSDRVSDGVAIVARE